MWGGSANVYNIGHKGGTYFWFNSQQNHDGFPMDGALVGVVSHNPQYLNPIHQYHSRLFSFIIQRCHK